MGWLFYHRPRGESDRDHFAAKMSEHYEILDCTTISNVFYAAVRDNRDQSVTAWVILIRRQRGEFNFGYKDMDETMGPNGCNDCPPRILDLLTPTDNEWANKWRAECRQQIARKAEMREKTSDVVTGTTIVLNGPLNFGKRYGEADTFRCVGGKGRNRRWLANPGVNEFHVRLPQDWATRYRWEIKETA